MFEPIQEQINERVATAIEQTSALWRKRLAAAEKERDEARIHSEDHKDQRDSYAAEAERLRGLVSVTVLPEGAKEEIARLRRERDDAVKMLTAEYHRHAEAAEEAERLREALVIAQTAMGGMDMLHAAGYPLTEGYSNPWHYAKRIIDAALAGDPEAVRHGYQEIRVPIRDRIIIIASYRSVDGSVVSMRVFIDDGTKRYVMEHAMSTYGGELWCDLSAISDIFRALSTRVLEGKL